MNRRSSYLRYKATIEIGQSPVTVWGYDKKGRFVCRVKLTAAGIEVKAGKFGTRKIADVTWEELVKRLS
jgi:hypothetical protein